MTKPTFDNAYWEDLWSKTLREHADKVALRPPNAHLVDEVADLVPGRALDAGCGHGAEALWLAARGWQVTALDFSAAALAQGRSMADAAGDDVAGRIQWIEHDLASWTPKADHYDLVTCLYVHVAGLSKRSCGAWRPVLLQREPCFWLDIGRSIPSPALPRGLRTRCKFPCRAAVAALDADAWDVVVAEERPRPVAGTG